MKKILFVCSENSARSQMAEAWFNFLYRGTLWKTASAGTKPAFAVNPSAVEVMAEVGIDISRAVSKMASPEELFSADKVITMGCIKGCPPSPHEKTEDWGLDDPSDKTIEEFRKIRDEIKKKVEDLISAIN
ncbi:MAG: arsenate reductase ArsC [Candidatus Altiarchaeota archaeon]